MNYIEKQSGNKQGTDYSKYHMNKKEWTRCVLKGMMIQGAVSYVFYDSGWAFIILVPITVWCFQKEKQTLAEKQKQQLQLQFKDAILAIATALEAGYSIENACKEAYFDMKLLYGTESLISKELFFLNRQIGNNMVLESVLLDFGKRSNIQDISDFAEIFRIAKRSGGNLSAIIQNTVEIISDKIEVKKEIETLISAKKMEQKIMNIIPFFIIGYIGFTSPGFFDPLYHNVMGIMIMTLCLILYAFAIFLAQKVTSISV